MRLRTICLLCAALIVADAGAFDLTGGEYFFDTDPGIGNGVPFTVAAGDSAEIVAAIATATLAPGVHTLYIRYREVAGTWSRTVSKPFTVLPADTSPSTPLTAAEYFFGADPGYGQGTPIEFADADSAEILTAIPTTGHETGARTLSIRYQTNGVWSRAAAKPFTLLPMEEPQATRIVSATAAIHGTLLSGATYDTTFALTPEDGALDSSFEATADVVLTGYAAAPRTLERGYYTLTVAYTDDLGNALPPVTVDFEVTSGLVIRAAYPGANDVSLRWRHAEIDNGYYSIYRGGSLDGVFSFVDSTTAHLYTHQNALLDPGQKYYRVTARYLGQSILVSGKSVEPLDPAYAETSGQRR